MKARLTSGPSKLFSSICQTTQSPCEAVGRSMHVCKALTTAIEPLDQEESLCAPRPGEDATLKRYRGEECPFCGMSDPWRKGGRKEAVMKTAFRLLSFRSMVVAVAATVGFCIPVLQFPMSCMLSLTAALQDGRSSPLCHATRHPASVSVLVDP